MLNDDGNHKSKYSTPSTLYHITWIISVDKQYNLMRVLFFLFLENNEEI